MGESGHDWSRSWSSDAFFLWYERELANFLTKTIIGEAFDGHDYIQIFWTRDAVKKAPRRKEA